MDVALMVAADRDNEARGFAALATLPDNAVRELQPGELEQYAVIRIADDILVDLMRVPPAFSFCFLDQTSASVTSPRAWLRVSLLLQPFSCLGALQGARAALLLLQTGGSTFSQRHLRSFGHWASIAAEVTSPRLQ